MNAKPSVVFLLLAAPWLGSAAGAQTVQGDILRGEGRLLRGAGWYNLNTARAGRINVESWKATNREVQRLYRDYMLDRARHIRRGKDLTNRTQADMLRKLEEEQRRWREDPTPEDISSGDALNALAGDLCDPSLDPSSWRGAQVELPPGLTLTALAFKIADPKKSKLQQSTVAIDRMLIHDRWPLPFRRPDIARECAAYEKSVAAVIDKCRKQTELQAADYDRLRQSVVTLQKAVETAIPSTDDQRRQAREYVRRLDEASKIFAEQAYAEQLIRDVSEHKATTVGELLAFMREYRLLFADPGSSPEVTSLYEGLYSLLRRQKEALGIRTEAAAAPVEAFSAGSMWQNGDADRPIRLRVVDRQRDRFHAFFSVGKDQPRVMEIHGEIDGNTIHWGADDVNPAGGPQAKAKAQAKKAQAKKAQAKAQFKAKAQAKKAQAQGGEIVGRISGNQIEFNGHPRLGNFVLRKAR